MVDSLILVYKMGNITSTDSRRRSGGIDNDVLVAAPAAVEGRPQKRIKLTNKTNDGSPKHTSVSSNNTSSSSGDGTDKTADNDDIEELTLPAECYALVLEYLDYQTVLSCALTSRVILHDAMPLVKTLHIDTALQMNIPLAARFRDVRHINLYSLLKGRVAVDEYDEDGRELLSVNDDAVTQVIPFLSQFDNLSSVFFGGRWIDGGIAAFCSYEKLWNTHGDSGHHDIGRVHTLINLISSSFRSDGGLRNSVQVMGLRCPYSRKVYNHENETECEVCKRACRSFPLDQVINFDNLGSSDGLEGLFTCKRTPCLDVCLSRSVIESIVEERPGGRDMLRSNARLLHLLGKGSMSEIRSDDGESLFIVQFVFRQKKELKRVIKYAELNTKEISGEIVNKALWHSFAKGQGYKVPPKDRCYLSRSALKSLVDKYDLPIDKEEFGMQAANVRNLAQIVKGLNSDSVVRHSCLNLLRHLLEDLGEGASTTIQKVVDLGVVPTLLEILSKKHGTRQKHVLELLSIIAFKGSDGNAQVLIDADAVPKLLLLLSSESDDNVVKESVLVLKHLASRSTAIRDVILKKGGLASLLQLSRQTNTPGNQDILAAVESLLFGVPAPDLDECEISLRVFSLLLDNYSTDEFDCKVLSYICHTPSKHQKAMIEAGLFPLLLDLMNLSPEVQEPALETIRSLLRHDESLVEEIIDSDKFPSLISSMFSPLKEVRNESCEILSCILNGKSTLFY